MLTIYDPADSRRRFCDGINRRGFLRIGGLALGGLTLPRLLEAATTSPAASRHKAVIMVYLCGGPPHQDMYDIKLDAPREIRGPFRAIPTNVPGIQVCEHLPRLAAMMDKLVPIRTVVGAHDRHESYQCMTGRDPVEKRPAGDWPHLGSSVAKLQGPVHRGTPPFVSLCYTTQHQPYNEPGPGMVGLANQSFRPNGPSRENMVLQGISSDRLADRRRLLEGVDQFRRKWDATGTMDGMDAFTEQAIGILTSSRLFEALDLSKEDPRTVERYGSGDEKRPRGDGAPRVPQNLLLARRLVEAGARVVTVNYSFWDWHGNNFTAAEDELPVFDRGLSALVEDLHERGLDRDVTVIAWGEFGRTPKVNKDAGRDHWPRVSCALMAGGGMKTGQVIGQTDRLGGEPIERAVTFPEVFATLYRNLGIDVLSTTQHDLHGRPHYMVDPAAEPLRELVG